MIDQELIDTMQDALDFDIEIDRSLVKELLTNYIKVIEDNAVIHKQSAKYKAQLKSLIQCSDMNTGNEPSLSVFQREIDISKEFIDYDDSEL